MVMMLMTKEMLTTLLCRLWLMTMTMMIKRRPSDSLR
jgi:hypothetical protein